MTRLGASSFLGGTHCARSLSVLVGLVGLVLSWLVPANASASDPQKREGFWLTFGGGYGYASASGADAWFREDGREGSLTGFLGLGGTLNSRMLLGLEGSVWLKDGDYVSATLGSLSGILTFYPQASSGLFLRCGAGLSYVSKDFNYGRYQGSGSKTGWGVLVALGYDLRVGRNVSLTPRVNYWYGKPGHLSFQSETLPDWKQDVIALELGITLH